MTTLHLERETVDYVRQHAVPLQEHGERYERLLAAIGPARFVLVGEASHGTREFYRERAALTRRLIEDHGFRMVAVEADWPDAWRVNNYLTGHREDPTADAALEGFKRFPTWMWRNREVLEFVQWLRQYNDSLPRGEPAVGFYGLDLYSLQASMQRVLDYLERVDPEAAIKARLRYACLDRFENDYQNYGYATRFGLSRSCEDAVVHQLLDIIRGSNRYIGLDGDEYFDAQENARLVKNAEEYYRTMLSHRTSSWNLRDRHMVETLEQLMVYRSHREVNPKVVVWAHNSHLGDARATAMAERGELNVGQLVRQRHGDKSFLVGFSSYEGTVTAAHDWDEPGRRRKVNRGLPGSWEALFHETGVARFALHLRGLQETLLSRPRLQRAIGVIYRPDTERQSHYYYAMLSRQFDAMLHLDHTHAVEPLDHGEWHGEEIPETYPTSL